MPEIDAAPAVETGQPDQLQPPDEDSSERRGAFRALRHRNYRLYFFGQLTSLAGTWMQSAAQAWLVLKLTNSATMLGVVSFAQFTPILLVGLFAGVIVDRVDRRRLIITTQILLMLSAFTLAALTWTGTVRVGYVILLAAFNGTVGSFDMPGRQSFVVEMVGYDDLANAIALNSMMFNSARMLGPAAAGLLIAWLGIGTCFFLNGVSFLAVIWSLTQMDIPVRVITGAGARMIHQLREGLAYVWSNRPIFYQMVLAAVTNGFGYQYLVLVPLFAKNVLHGDARTYGFLVAIQGLGSVVGAVTLASRVSTRGMRNNLLVGLFLSAVGIVVFGMSRSFRALARRAIRDRRGADQLQSEQQHAGADVRQRRFARPRDEHLPARGGRDDADRRARGRLHGLAPGADADGRHLRRDHSVERHRAAHTLKSVGMDAEP